jgi:hypothetical protein
MHPDHVEPTHNDLDAHAPGTTAVLTEEGWEASEYVAPGDDWQPQDDGSWLSPDHQTRTWLPAGPEPS